MLVAKYQTKKELKTSVGKSLRYQETSLFNNEYTSDGKLYVVGPGAYNRKFYAQVVMQNGLIKSVK